MVREDGMRSGRSRATRAQILHAAKMLFMAKGYEEVTMREIAGKAQCSHTAIYLYFKDKRALLHEIAMPHLEQLHDRLEEQWREGSGSPDAAFQRIGMQFVKFCLANRSLVPLLFLTEADRVDDPAPSLPVNRLRNAMFGLLMRSLSACLGIGEEDPRLLMFSRIAFFALFGIIGTYTQGRESADELLDRLEGTFEETLAVLLAGFRNRLAEGDAGRTDGN